MIRNKELDEYFNSTEFTRKIAEISLRTHIEIINFCNENFRGEEVKLYASWWSVMSLCLVHFIDMVKEGSKIEVYDEGIDLLAQTLKQKIRDYLGIKRNRECH